MVRGNGLVLTIGDRRTGDAVQRIRPGQFPGDTPTRARLIAGEITDLNVMTRRGRFSHRLLRIAQPTSCDFGGDDIAMVAVAQDGMPTAHGTRRRRSITATRPLSAANAP